MTLARRIRVVVADDHAVVREGIRTMLSSTKDVEVIGEASDGSAALAMALELEPDVLLLDITMPKLSGLEVAAAVRSERPGVRVLVLSMHDHPEYVLRAVRAGASGYVLKDAQPDELRAAIRAVHQGREYFHPEAARKLSTALREESARARRRSALDLLTPRERDVLVRIARGLTNKEIAAEFGISPRTVETHRDSLSRKLGIRSVADLTRLVLEAGLGEGHAGRLVPPANP